MRVAGYEFSENARFQPGADVEAGVVGAHLDHLRKHHKGELTPADVVEDAKNPNSPLHPFFEWSDTKAAREYRLQQARGLIRSIVAIYVSPNEPARRINAFVHIPEPGAPHYREASHAMSQERTRALVLQRAWAEFQAWRRRYADLREFSSLFDLADEVERKIPRR